MNGFSIALFIHLVSLLLAVVISALATHAELRLRASKTIAEAAGWGRFVHRIVPGFSVASLGLLASGAYMTQTTGTWASPWLVAGIVGFVAIIVLGAGVSGRCGRALMREMQAAGLSERAGRMMRDPVDWSARITGQMLLVAVVFVMTAKPQMLGSVAALVVAVVAGLVIAVPLWRKPAIEAGAVEDSASAS